MATREKPKMMFTTTVLGVGPFCIEFEDGEIVYTRSERRRRLTAFAPEMYEALREIAKGEGAFNREPLIHAGNVIERHKAIAGTILTKIDGAA